MEDVSFHPPDTVELPRQQARTEILKPPGVVELVPIHPEHPCAGPCKGFEQIVGFGRMAQAVDGGVRERTGEVVEDLCSPVRRAVVAKDQGVAEGSDVPHRLGNKKILIADQDDTDNFYLAHEGSGSFRALQLRHENRLQLAPVDREEKVRRLGGKELCFLGISGLKIRQPVEVELAGDFAGLLRSLR